MQSDKEGQEEDALHAAMHAYLTRACDAARLLVTNGHRVVIVLVGIAGSGRHALAQAVSDGVAPLVSEVHSLDATLREANGGRYPSCPHRRKALLPDAMAAYAARVRGSMASVLILDDYHTRWAPDWDMVKDIVQHDGRWVLTLTPAMVESTLFTPQGGGKLVAARVSHFFHAVTSPSSFRTARVRSDEPHQPYIVPWPQPDDPRGEHNVLCVHRHRLLWCSRALTRAFLCGVRLLPETHAPHCLGDTWGRIGVVLAHLDSHARTASNIANALAARACPRLTFTHIRVNTNGASVSLGCARELHSLVCDAASSLSHAATRRGACAPSGRTPAPSDTLTPSGGALTPSGGALTPSGGALTPVNAHSLCLTLRTRITGPFGRDALPTRILRDDDNCIIDWPREWDATRAAAPYIPPFRGVSVHDVVAEPPFLVRSHDYAHVLHAGRLRRSIRDTTDKMDMITPRWWRTQTAADTARAYMRGFCGDGVVIDELDAPPMTLKLLAWACAHPNVRVRMDMPDAHTIHILMIGTPLRETKALVQDERDGPRNAVQLVARCPPQTHDCDAHEMLVRWTISVAVPAPEGHVPPSHGDERVGLLPRPTPSNSMHR